MGIVAVSMAFTSCKDDEEEPENEQPTEQTSFSYSLQGETSWEPKTLLLWPEENYIGAFACVVFLEVSRINQAALNQKFSRCKPPTN